MNKVDFCDYINIATEKLKGNGVFLTAGKTPNTMTIGWGSIGYYWGKPVFVVPVRHSRHTHTILEECGEFTVSVPLGDMKKELGFCGSKSGRDVNKIEALGLKTAPAENVNTSVILNTGLHFECRVVMKSEFGPLDSQVKEKWYANDDYHTLYFGEIISCYTE